MKKFLVVMALLFWGVAWGEARPVLKESIQKAEPGEFVVICQGKVFTLFHVVDNEEGKLVIEEIAVAGSRIPRNRYSWKQWVEAGGPGNMSWVVYKLNTRTGRMERGFSYTKNGWFTIDEADNLLTTLLNLQFAKVPEAKRKKVGPRQGGAMQEWRRVWQPPLVVNGRAVPGASFEAWRTMWPNDGSELAGKMIEVYMPEEGSGAPRFFPYWVQASGAVARAKVRVIDSGSGLQSPRNSPL